MSDDKNEWIKLSDQRPPKGDDIEVAFIIGPAYYSSDGKRFFAKVNDTQAVAIEEPTHWRLIEKKCTSTKS